MNVKKKTILLVEDQALIAMTQKNQLEKYGYAVGTATSGEKALEAIQASPDIDLVLMDIDLGRGIDGTEAAVRILRERDIPIVFLSSHTSPEVVEKTEKITSYGYVVKNSSMTVLDASIKMAFKLFDEKMERKEVERELRESQELYRGSIEALSYPFAVINAETYSIELANSQFGGPDVVGRTCHSVLYGKAVPCDDADTPCPIRLLKEERRPITLQHAHRNEASAPRCAEISTYPIFDDEGRLVRMAASRNDITERNRAEEALTQSKALLTSAIDGLSANIAVIDEGGEIILTNKAYREFAERNGADPVTVSEGTNYLVVCDIASGDDCEEAHSFAAGVRDVLSGEREYFELEYPCHSPSEERWFVARVTPVEGDPRRVIVAHEKITDRRKAEKQIQKELTEKENLLREVHHRVKNNMATIESLLSLQANSAGHAEVKQSLQDTISRVQSTRVLYEKLLVSADLREVSVRQYADGLIDSLARVFDHEKRVTINKRIADFEIGAKKAFFLGIIINELLTNVFKYAFADDHEDGTVCVRIDKEDGDLSLVIQDNGVGFDDRALKNESPGFGLTVVRMLVEQSGGTYSLSNQDGARTSVRFKL